MSTPITIRTDQDLAVADHSLNSYQADQLVWSIQAVVDAAAGSTAEAAVNNAVENLIHHLNLEWMPGWQIDFPVRETQEGIK